jgi:hypothetical protein
MFDSHSPTEGGPAAHTLPPTQHTSDDSLPIYLREHLTRLQLILPIISVAVMALRRQNAELDEDIAMVLDHHATEALDAEIEHLETFLASLACRPRQREVAA